MKTTLKKFVKDHEDDVTYRASAVLTGALITIGAIAAIAYAINSTVDVNSVETVKYSDGTERLMVILTNKRTAFYNPPIV